MLYIVPTPIGNLGDMTFRAVEVLKTVDLILAEDTRTSAVLLKHFDITTPLTSYHQHNEHKIVEHLTHQLAAGKSMALITDAGTPGISDPAFLLVRSCVRNGITVSCLPGATAFVPALVASGMPADRFTFEGFLPLKKGRKTKLDQLAGEDKTIILYESPVRLFKTLNELSDVLGANRSAVVCREISKKFEQFHRGTLSELAAYFAAHPAKGEVVLVIEGAGKN
jgi:16S rRNA (cytidine1402-2'-O)-methyltransferase